MFTFKGKTASEMGINVLPFSRTLRAEKRLVQTYIQGRDGTYDWSDDSYANGRIEIPCRYFGSTAPQDLRTVAAWLNGSGNLSFDDEPDKHYRATMIGAITREQMLYEDSFTLTFSIFPFALGELKTKTQVLAASGDSITVKTSGTAKTPARIIYQNAGNTTVDNITITVVLPE